jgi:hypothetical protein
MEGKSTNTHTVDRSVVQQTAVFRELTQDKFHGS